MAFLPYPPTTVASAIAVLKQDIAIAHDVVHGDNTTNVDTESGLVPSFSKLVKTLTDEVEAATGVDISLRSELASVNSTALVGGIQAKILGIIGGSLITPEQFGAIGDGIADDTTPIFNWLNYLTGNPLKRGLLNGKVYLINDVSLVALNGLTIIGSGVIKAMGSSRLNMLGFVDVRGKVSIDGNITFDGSNIVARPFEIKNIGGTTAGDVYIGEGVRFINAKNIAPATNNASGIRVQGNFNHFIFAGEVDGVEDTQTSGAVAVGVWADWTGTSFIKNVTLKSTSKIKNVKNSNTVTADADGVQRMGPTTEHLTFTVEEGAYFENCKGRSIKSQVTNNSINSPVIVRNAYDGVVEIDCQYAGGYVEGARIFYDGVRSQNVISSTTRLNLPSNFTMRDNVLTLKNPPVQPTENLCLFWGVDTTDSIKQEGLVCSGNKVVGGTVNHLLTVYAANVVDTNRVVIKDNYAHNIATSFLNMQLVFNNPSQLTVVFENNACRVPCVGATVISGGRMTVESDRNNSKINPLPQFPVIIAGGVLTVYAGNVQLVATEGGAGLDDITTISGGSYSSGDVVMFKAAYDAQKPTFKNGAGNIYLAGSDFELNSVRDVLVLSYDAVLNQWHEVSRANNG